MPPQENCELNFNADIVDVNIFLLLGLDVMRKDGVIIDFLRRKANVIIMIGLYQSSIITDTSLYHKP